MAYGSLQGLQRRLSVEESVSHLDGYFRYKVAKYLMLFFKSFLIVLGVFALITAMVTVFTLPFPWYIQSLVVVAEIALGITFVCYLVEEVI